VSSHVLFFSPISSFLDNTQLMKYVLNIEMFVIQGGCMPYPRIDASKVLGLGSFSLSFRSFNFVLAVCVRSVSVIFRC